MKEIACLLFIIGVILFASTVSFSDEEKFMRSYCAAIKVGQHPDYKNLKGECDGQRD